MQIPQEYIYECEAAIEQWTDSRVISPSELQNLLLFLLYVPRVFSQCGHTLLGFSFRQKHGQYLMTIKCTEGETPLVVFVTSDTPIGCMFRFLDLMEDDRLTFVRDRYPWI